jgi:hypothetical protein
LLWGKKGKWEKMNESEENHDGMAGARASTDIPLVFAIDSIFLSTNFLSSRVFLAWPVMACQVAPSASRRTDFLAALGANG